jgi:diguanylate cyclase (GGDEF)-like protein/PAS domain S-box-containing protein
MILEPTLGKILSTALVSCPPEATISEAAQAMQDAKCSSILIMEKGEAAGIWTEHDALALDFSNPRVLDTPVGLVMSSPLITIGKNVTVTEAGRRLKDENIRHFVVVDEDGRMMGVVSQTDVVRHFGLQHYLSLRDVTQALPRSLATVEETLPYPEAVRRMRAQHADAAVVVDANEAPVGIVTERDLVRMIAQRAPVANVGELASRPLFTVAPSTTLLHARDLLEQKGFRHLGVEDEMGALIGLLSMSDILTNLEHVYVRRLEEALKQRDSALLESKRHLWLAHKVIEASLDGIVITNADGVIETVNPAFTRLTGFEMAEAVGKKPNLLSSGRHDASFYAAMWHALKTKGHWQGEVWNRKKNGDVYPEWLTITRLDDPDGGGVKYAGIFADITDRKKSEERIRNLAYFDVLTGLPNRRLFNDRLAVAMSAARRHRQRLAVMFLDLDLFKRINDTLGHGVGDSVLVEMSERLKSCVRDCDTVARMGGDEFTIMQSEIVSAEDAARLARRVIDSICLPFQIDNRELYLTTSVGIAIFPEDGDDPEVLVKNADIAMYRAKDLGRNSYQLYTPSMNAKSFERLAMESALRKALERNEFLLNFQVKVDLITGQIAGAEALIRWMHPDLGLVSPADFIPLAEETGLIVGIGDWVIAAACAQNKAWQERGLGRIRIAVNISPRQFRQPDLVSRVRTHLLKSQLDPQYLEIEVTESVLMEHMDIAAHMLEELRHTGVRVSIDDFGTGYSSLSYLKRIPIDALKIDASFMPEIASGGGDAEIVSAIIALAHNLRLKVVAEGVETEEQVNFLRDKNCDEIQGFLVSRPLSAENFESLFERNLLMQPPGVSSRPGSKKG